MMTRMYKTTIKGRPDLHVNVEANPYGVQEYLASFRRSKSAMVISDAKSSRWSCLPERKVATAREVKKAPKVLKSYDEDDHDAYRISLGVARSPLSSRSRPEPINVNNSVETNQPIAACATKYFPYRRSGYLDHMIRQSRVNSARVLLCEHPDMVTSMPTPRVRSAQPPVVAAVKVAPPIRAQTAELVREQESAKVRRRQEMKLRKVEIKDSGMGSLKTKEFTTDNRNVYYTRRTKQDVGLPKETIKAVRFDGGFQEAVISPRQRELVPELVPDKEEPSPREVLYNPRNGIIREYQPPMDTSVSKETNHIPLNIYKSQNGTTVPPMVSRKKTDIDDYNYKTEKILSYYLQQERRPGTAKFNFTAQNKLKISQGNKPPSRGRLIRTRSQGSESQGQSEFVQPNLGGGFLKIHKPLVLHQRPAEEENESESINRSLKPEAQPSEDTEQKTKKHSHVTVPHNEKPPIDPANLCLLCNCSNTDNWKMVDAILSQSSAHDLTLPALNKTMKH